MHTEQVRRLDVCQSVPPLGYKWPLSEEEAIQLAAPEELHPASVAQTRPGGGTCRQVLGAPTP